MDNGQGWIVNCIKNIQCERKATSGCQGFHGKTKAYISETAVD